MINLRLAIVEHSAELPAMDCGNFFHSAALFGIYESTPRMRPLMVVASDGAGRVLAHLLAVVRRRSWALPPFFYSHCIVLGEGEYAAGADREVLFGRMLGALTRRLQGRVLYIEFSHLGSKMFGYAKFRGCGFFPIHWLNVHNSLHSRKPEERLSAKMRRRIERVCRKDVATAEVAGEADLEAFGHLLKRHNRLKPKRYIPDMNFFRELLKTGNGKLFLTKHKGRVVGCCACVFSAGNAYLWYSAALRKSYARLHPLTATVWNAIKYAHENKYAHMCFMDVGLPFQRNPYREFILQFGGKPVSTYRWFRFSFKWVNALLAWLYRD